MSCMQVFTTAQGEWAPESISLTSAGLVQISMPSSGQISQCLGTDVFGQSPIWYVSNSGKSRVPSAAAKQPSIITNTISV